MAAPSGTILLTGANGGLGTAVVDAILSRPDLSGFHGIYAVRDASTATALQSALQGTQSHTHKVLSLDLSNLESVRRIAASVNAKVSAGEIPRIRALILNAAYREHQGQTKARHGRRAVWISPSRIVVLGSWVHDPLDDANQSSGAYEDPKWKTIFADSSSETVESVIQGEWSPPGDPSKDPYGFAAIRRYGASKLCLAMMIVELQSRLNSDPKLSGISVLGVDPGLMPIKITTGGLPWLIGSIYTLAFYIFGHIWPNGTLRLKQKSAGDVLAAAFDTKPPFGERPKSVYMNGSEPKEVGIEAQDEQKRATVWKASIRYAELREGETSLMDWT